MLGYNFCKNFRGAVVEDEDGVGTFQDVIQVLPLQSGDVEAVPYKNCSTKTNLVKAKVAKPLSYDECSSTDTSEFSTDVVDINPKMGAQHTMEECKSAIGRETLPVQVSRVASLLESAVPLNPNLEVSTLPDPNMDLANASVKDNLSEDLFFASSNLENENRDTATQTPVKLTPGDEIVLRASKLHIEFEKN